MPTAGDHYDGVAIAFHWLIAILIVVNVVVAWSLDSFDHHSPIHETILTVHKSIGTTILLLAAFRLAWRAAHPAPPLPTTVPPWQHLAARVDQGLLYALLFLMPVTGLVDAAAFTQPVNFFFLFHLPTVIDHDEPLGHLAMAIHKISAKALYVLLAVHAAAALNHHYRLKDNVLRRMLPR